MQYLLPYLGLFTIIAIVIIGAMRYRILTFEMKVLFFYFILDAAVSLLQYILANMQINNLWTTHFLVPFEYGILIWIFTRWMDNARWQQYSLISIPIFLLIWLATIITIEDLATFSKVGRPLKSLGLVIVSIYVIKTSMRDISVPVLMQPRFWMSSGTFIYNAGNIIMTLLANQILSISHEMLGTVWMVHNLVSLLSYFLFAGAFLCLRR